MSLLNSLFGPPNIRKLKAKGNVKELINALSYEKDRNVQVAAARVLGEIGDAKAAEALRAIGTTAVGPLDYILRHAKSLPMRLASYSVLEKIPSSNTPETEVQKLVEDVAIEIRRLYSRTRTGIKHITTHTQFTPGVIITDEGFDVEVELHDPDIYGIRELIALIPETLHERVRAVSGQVKSEEWLWS